MNAKNSIIWKLLSTLVILAVMVPATLFVSVPAALADSATVQIAANNDDAFDYANGSNYPDRDYIRLGNRSGSSYGNCTGGFHFQVPIPQGSKINSAYLKVRSTDDTTTSLNLKIYADKTDNSSDFASIKPSDASRPRTTAQIDWDTGTTRWNSGNTYNSPDIRTVVQEIISRTNWASNNYLSIIVANDSGPSDNNRDVDSIEGGYNTQLIIDYTLPPLKLGYSNEAGYGGSVGVNPDSGTSSTNFVYKTVYTQTNNIAPTLISVVIDGIYTHTMSLDGTAAPALRDHNYANGEQYVYTTTLGHGTHDYYFIAKDGTYTARLPGSGTQIGPGVDISVSNPIRDSYIDQSSSGTNYGNLDHMYVRSDQDRNGNGQNRRMFLRFNLPGLPTCPAGTAGVIGAALRVYADTAPSGLRTYDAYRVTGDWLEVDPNGIDWNPNQPETAGFATSAKNVNATGWTEWDVTADVQGFLGGSYSNYGWMIRDRSESEPSSGVQTNFRSREYSDPSYRPQLLISYNCPPLAPTLVAPPDLSATSDGTPTLSWNAASDPNGDTLRYEIRMNAGSWNPDPGTATSYTTTLLPQGGYTWQVRAYDGHVYSDPSVAWLFTIDTDTPGTPDHLYEGSPDQDYYSSTNYSLLINWGSVPDTGSGITYELSRTTNGGASWTLVYNGTEASFTDSINPAGNDTTIQYRVRACTGAHICGGVRASDGVTIDSDDPATVTGVGEGKTVGTPDNWSIDNVYYVYWNTVADTGSGISYEVQRSRNNGGWEGIALSGLTCDTHPGHCWGDDPTGYSDRDNVRYRVRAVNGAGRASSAWSTPSSGITLDLSAPDSSVNTGGVFTPGTWPAGGISGNASDSGSGVARVHITIYDANAGSYWGGSAWVSTTTWITATGTTGWSYPLSGGNLTDGHTYLVESRATDIAGNVEFSFGTNNFAYGTTMPDAPQPWSTSHVDPNVWYTDNTPSFAWNVPASSLPIAGYSVLLDQFPGSIPDISQETSGTTYDAPTTADGTWYFHVRAINNGGTAGPTGHVRVNIDTTTPQAPASVTEESPDVAWDADGNVTVYWTAVPNTGSGITYRLEYSRTGASSWTLVSGAGALTTTSYLVTGAYNDNDLIEFRVRATNGVSLVGAWTQSNGVRVDSQHPAQPGWVYDGNPDIDYSAQANGAVTVQWQAVANTGSGITYRLVRWLNGHVDPDFSGGLTTNNSYADSGSYADGDVISYTVTAINGVGLEGPSQASDGFTIDLDIPAMPTWVREGVNTEPDWDYDFDGAFTVYWDSVPDTGSGIYYRLEKSVNDGAWQLVADKLAGTSYPDTNPSVLDGVRIRYRVTPFNNAGTPGSYFLSDGITLDRDTPEKPAWIYENNPDVDYHPTGAVWVNWAPVPDTGSGITYDLQQSINGSVFTTIASSLLATNYNITTTFADETLIRYQVQARNGVGRVSLNDPVNGWAQSDGVRVDADTPLTPTNVIEGLVVGSDLDYVNVNTFYVFWTGVGSTATGDYIRYTIERNVNGGGWSGAATNVTATSWDDPQAFSNGDQVAYRVSAVNGAGTASPVSDPSDGITLDTGQPNSVVQTSGYYNASTWPGQINGTTSDDYSGVANIHVMIHDIDANRYWDGAAWVTGATWLMATNTINWYYTLNKNNLTDGHTYDVQSSATDVAGNVETSYGVNSFTFASRGPQAPVITSTTHLDQNTWYNLNAPAFSWTTVSSATVTGYSGVLDQNPGTTPAPSVNILDNSISFTNQPDGTWYFHVRALDQANNWGPAGHYRINIDTTTPGAPISVTEESPDIDWDLDGNVTVYWTAVANTGSGITYQLEYSHTNAPTWTPVAGADALTITHYLVTGTYSDNELIEFQVHATNGVGLVGAWTQSNGVRVDSDVPATPAWIFEKRNAADPNVDQAYDPDGKVAVAWAASNNTGSGLTYRLERRVTPYGGSAGSWTEIASGLGSTSYLDPLTHNDGDFVEYRVTAVNGVGSVSAPATSNGIRIDTDTPNAPDEVTENSPDIDWSLNGSVTVYWGSVDNTGSSIAYELQRCWKGGLSGNCTTGWLPVASNITDTTSYNHNPGGYSDGDTVRYRVRATSGAGLSGAWRESNGMTIDNTPVAAPAWVIEENPDVDYHATGAVWVYWKDVVNTGSGISYRLDRCVNGGLVGLCTTSWETIAPSLVITSYYDAQTKPDATTVRYQVTAINGVSTPSSPTVSDGVTVDRLPPDVPANVGEGTTPGIDIEFVKDNTFWVFWDAVAPKAAGDTIKYTVERRRNGGVWEQAGMGLACGETPCRWDDQATFSNGDTVQYHVLAVNGAGSAGVPSGASDGITMDFAQPDSSVSISGYYNSFNWPPGVIRGTASDSLSDVAYVDLSIQRRSDSYYWDGTAWKSSLTTIWLRATDTHNWQYPFPLANLTNGVTYDVLSRATDNVGNVETTWGTNSFTYAGTGPGAPTISSPTHSVQTNWYNNNNPTFNWITPTSSATVVGYSYLLDQVPGTTPDTQADTAGTTASYTGQADGTWWFHVRAGDDAGNWGPAGHFRINIDTTPPTAPLTLTEEYPDVDWDSDGSVTVYWAAVANTGSGITYSLEYSRTSSPSWAQVPGAGALAGTNFTVGGFANGERALFHVRATNGVTLTSGWTTSDGVSFDTTTPSAPTNVGEGDIVGSDDDWDQVNTFWVFWTAVPTTPSGITYSVERNRNNSGTWEPMVAGWATTQWDDPTSYSNGESVAYRVTAHTGAGLSSAPSASSDGLTLDFVQPGSAINTNSYYNNYTWLGYIQGIGTDDRSGVRYVDITLRRQSDNYNWNGTTWVSGTVWLRATGAANWTYPFTPGDGQTYYVQSRATDYADNVQSALGTSTFNYSSSGPGVPVISSPTHPNPAVWYNNNDPTLNWTTPPSGSGIKGYSYILDHTPDTEPDLAADTAGNTRSYLNITDGLWYFHVRAVDNADNWGPAAHFAVRVDTTAPAAPASVTEESPDVNLDADGNITVYWSGVTDVSPVTYQLECSTNGGSSWTPVATGITMTSRLDPVTHPDATVLVYHVRAVDAVNLTSGWTQSNGVTVDSEIPAQPTGVGEGNVVGTDDIWDRDQTFFVFWNAVPDTGSSIVYTIERRLNGGAWQVAQSNYAQTFWDDPQIFADTSIIHYRITAVNGVGTVGPTSLTSSGITMDFVQPDSAIGTNGTYGPASWTGSITGTASDATSGVGQVHITIQRVSDSWYWNGAMWQATPPQWLLATGTTAWSYAFGPSNNESYNVQSRATDNADNAEVSYGVSSFSYSSNEPDSWVTTSGLYVGAAWPGHIAGTASAPAAAVSFVDIILQRASNGQYWDGAVWAAVPAWLRATGANPWAYAFAPADGETYTVTSRATDSVGNVEGIYGRGGFSYDLAAPAIATMSVASDKVNFYDPGLNADGGTVYFSSRAGEGAGQTLIVTVAFSEPHPYRMVGAAAFGDTPPADMAAPWTAQYSVEANAGTQSGVLFTAYDTLGLNDTATINFVEDNLAPSSQAYIAADATNAAPILVDWDANDSASGVRRVHLWVKFQPLGAWADTGLVMTGVSGQFAYTPTSGRGTYYFATVAEDNVSNVEPLPTGLGDDHIKFDNVPSISTANAPTYAIAAPIVITWTTDAETDYTYLFYRFGDTGPFTPTSLPFSTDKSSTFAFVPAEGDGHYYFATVAIDDAGNVEPIASDGKTMTIYDTMPPTSTATSPAEWGGFDFTVEWTGDDTVIGSGIAFYDIQVKMSDGVWTDWITHTTAVSATYTATYVGQPDATYHFRSRATDNAGHVEAWPAAENGDTTTLVHFPGSFPGRYKLFLPLVTRSQGGQQLPDLTVTAITVTPSNPVAGQPVDLAVTIKNQGTLATSGCFWTDLYINPSRRPQYNDTWDQISSEGLTWYVCNVGIGESITLRINDSHFRSDYSRFSGTFAAPIPYTLYAQVDNWNSATSYGGVYESNEQNNVYGPQVVPVSGAAVMGASPENKLRLLPTRPDPTQP